MSKTTIEHVITVVRNGLAAGVPHKDIRDTLTGSVVVTPGVARAWKAVARDDKHALTALRAELADCVVPDNPAFQAKLTSLERRVDRAMRGTVELIKDAGTDLTRTWWHPPPTADLPPSDGGHCDRPEENLGRVVLVGVHGAQVGERNRQLNMFVHIVEDPKIDFEALMGNSTVSSSLAMLAADPGNIELRRAAVRALSGVQQSAADWTTSYAGTGTAVLGSGAHALDGTVAVIRSKAVQVGDRQYQENTIVHTVSPDIAAAALLHDPDVVNGLIDVACAPSDTRAMAAFERAVGGTVVSELAESPVTRRGHGMVLRPPAAGRTLHIADAAGVSVGKHASQKTRFAQTAHIGRTVRTSAGRVADEVQHRSGMKMAKT